MLYFGLVFEKENGQKVLYFLDFFSNIREKKKLWLARDLELIYYNNFNKLNLI